MVLLELSKKISFALKKLGDKGTCGEEDLKEWLQGVCKALLQSDVNFRTVVALRTALESDTANILDENPNISVRAIQQQLTTCLVKRLSEVLEPEKKEPELTRGGCNIVMFVGLEGAGKTTTVIKFANYYKRKGFAPAVVCADTFRAGAYDQLCQQAAKLKIPFFGMRDECDPTVVASTGVAQFQEGQHDLIIVDTSGRHKQEAALFEEMVNIQETVEVTHVVLVIDSHLGQACSDQAKAFADAVPIGSVIVTKMDGNAKGGGAVAAVAATGAPITFIGTGEQPKDFDKYSSKGFVSELLGMGNLDSVFDQISNMTANGGVETVENILKGQFTYDDLYKQTEMISNMNISSLLSKIPGMSPGVISDEDEKAGYDKLKKLKIIIQSMTKEERAAKVELDAKRMRRLAIGSGTSIVEVQSLKDQYALMKSIFKNMSSNMNSMMQGMEKGGPGGGMPDLSAMFGGGGGGMPDMSSIMNMMGGGAPGNFGGMPGNMQDMMKAMPKPKAKPKSRKN